MRYKVKTTEIGYCIEEEDVCWQFDNQADLEEDSEEYYDAIHAEIERLERELPQELILNIECEPEDLEDMVVDAVSEATGWLNNYVNYVILESKPE